MTAPCPHACRSGWLHNGTDWHLCPWCQQHGRPAGAEPWPKRTPAVTATIAQARANARRRIRRPNHGSAA